ncbi:unnamed protein product [Rhizophagus irregularis]|nr:unnamed protein product [Rhizophagus irregularis]
MGYSNYWCIVSAGAPGIGKTRFGIELFDYIKQNLEPPEEWGDAHFEYLYMNFRNNFYLSRYDSELKSECSALELFTSTTLLNLEAPIKKGTARKGVAPKIKGVALPTTKHVYKWKLCAPLLQLLIDTGGLPCALE